MRPPKPEILPGFWEQHGVLIALAGLGCLAAIVILWRLLSRPKPPVIPAPAEVARQSLASLRPRREDKALLTEVSSILRKYFIGAFALPNEEFTNSELCRHLAADSKAGPELSTAATELLEGMEHRRFNEDVAPQGSADVPPVAHLNGAGPAISEPSQPPAPTGTQAEATGKQAGRLCHVSTVEQALKLVDQAQARFKPPPAEADPATA